MNDTLIGGFISIITFIVASIINYWSQNKLLEKQFQQKLLLDEQQLKIKKIEEKKRIIEELYKLLLEIRFDCSTTHSFIVTEIKTIKDFHEWYLNALLNKINRVDIICSLYLTDNDNITKLIEKIRGEANKFWGYQQQYLKLWHSGNYENAELKLKEVIKSANNIGETTTYLLREIKNTYKQHFN